jgi:hypothetical protein
VSDSISFKIDDRLASTALTDINRGSERAVMYALRSTGRIIKRTSQARAPVWRDRTGIDGKTFTYGSSKVTKIPGDGMLRKSISASKRLQREGPLYVLRVSPHGYANYYAGKEEARSPYMSPGLDAGVAAFRTELENAVAKVIWRHSTGGTSATF